MTEVFYLYADYHVSQELEMLDCETEKGAFTKARQKFSTTVDAYGKTPPGFWILTEYPEYPEKNTAKFYRAIKTPRSFTFA